MKLKILLAAGAMISLAACQAVQGPLSAVGQMASAVISPADDAPAATVDPALFAPDVIAAQPQDFLVVTVNAAGLNEMARLQQRSGLHETYLTQSGFQFTLNQGMLLSSRGFGDDLVTTGAIDPEALLLAIRSGTGQVTRIVERLNAQSQIESQNFTCTFTIAGEEEVALALSTLAATRVNERCSGAQMIFDNIYWLDQQQKIAASRQYVSPSVAYLRFNRL
ncbi:YjbF family lipoprotein [Ketogulonicigenium vulgare]|uniref:YjbF family lipoprotein n=1 Tax=Ketogulonicigenium vulgare TaxID=92945 RepID=UPI0023597C26|nr:YjbF family lipoprotein [Ketogulonicigenium vulgare]